MQLDPQLSSVYIAGMFFFCVLTLGGYIARKISKDNEKSRDGSYGLECAKHKAKADIITNEVRLKLAAAKPEFEKVDVELDGGGR